MKDVGADDGGVGSLDPGSDDMSEISDVADEPFVFDTNI